jgi:hypothetical protein
MSAPDQEDRRSPRDDDERLHTPLLVSSSPIRAAPCLGSAFSRRYWR